MENFPTQAERKQVDLLMYIDSCPRLIDHKPVGYVLASVNDLMNDRREFDLKKAEDPSKKDSVGKKAETIGKFRFLQCSEEQDPTFLDYIQGGCQINLHIAVDFTMSNGDPNLPESLHYKGRPGSEFMNDYEHAILAVGRILLDYDSDKKVPLYGFGGKLPDKKISHCWPLNGNEQDPSCNGLEEIFRAYRLALENVDLAAPTNFAPTVNRLVAEVHEEKKNARHTNKQSYHVLLLITDGAITDMDSTIRALIRASKLPISIIIVGVGKADFSNMHVLDGNVEPIEQDGDKAARDIVHFVEYRQFQDQRGDARIVEQRLAKTVLTELPDQIVEYFRGKGIAPNRRAHNPTNP